MASADPSESAYLSLSVEPETLNMMQLTNTRNSETSIDMPSLARRRNDRRHAANRSVTDTRSADDDVDDRVYWVKELETGERHYAFILEDPQRRVYTVWFFTSKRNPRTGVDQGVLFDYKDFRSHEAAEQHLVTNDFRKISGSTPSDMPKPPTRLYREAVNLHKFLASYGHDRLD